VGKSALSTRFAEALRSRGVSCEHLAFPGNALRTLGHHVYRLHHDAEQFDLGPITPAAVQLLHIAAHIDAIEGRILPLLGRGITVVLDRYWWSTYVYGVVGGARRDLIEAMIQVELAAWGGLTPSVAFLIRRDSPLRPEPLDAWSRWRALYDELGRDEAGKYPVRSVENGGTLDHALRVVIDALD
jgi:thymidylate kinase